MLLNNVWRAFQKWVSSVAADGALLDLGGGAAPTAQSMNTEHDGVKQSKAAGLADGVRCGHGIHSAEQAMARAANNTRQRLRKCFHARAL